MNKVISIFLLSMFVFFSAVSAQEKSKHVFIVIDTSLSMLGKDGGKLVFPSLKEKLKSFIENFKVGDKVTLATFDTATKFRKTQKIDKISDKQTLISKIEAIRARGVNTYSNWMFSQVHQAIKEKIQKDQKMDHAILILSDALDDPPQRNSKKVNTKNITPISKDESFVYYFTLNQDVSEDLEKKITKFFPDALLKKVYSDEKYRSDLFEDPANASSLSSALDRIHKDVNANVYFYQITQFKEGKKIARGKTIKYTIEIEPNQLAEGKKISLTSDNSNVVIGDSQKEFIMNARSIKVPLEVTIPYRISGSTLDFKITGEFKDENDALKSLSKSFSISVGGLCFYQKLLHLPEYYIPALLLLLLILFGVFKAYKYYTFISVLEFQYWEVKDEEEPVKEEPVKEEKPLNKYKKKEGVKEVVKEDPEDQIITTEFINVLEFKKKKILISNKENATIRIEALDDQDELKILKKGKKRKTRLVISTKEKKKVEFIGKFKGKSLKNETEFLYGGYQFKVITNLLTKK